MLPQYLVHAQPLEDDAQAALHESGHAVMARLVGARPVLLDLDSGHDTAGHAYTGVKGGTAETARLMAVGGLAATIAAELEGCTFADDPHAGAMTTDLQGINGQPRDIANMLNELVPAAVDLVRPHLEACAAITEVAQHDRQVHEEQLADLLNAHDVVSNTSVDPSVLVGAVTSNHPALKVAWFEPRIHDGQVHVAIVTRWTFPMRWLSRQ